MYTLLLTQNFFITKCNKGTCSCNEQQLNVQPLILRQLPPFSTPYCYATGAILCGCPPPPPLHPTIHNQSPCQVVVTLLQICGYLSFSLSLSIFLLHLLSPPLYSIARVNWIVNAATKRQQHLSAVRSHKLNPIQRGQGQIFFLAFLELFQEH